MNIGRKTLACAGLAGLAYGTYSSAAALSKNHKYKTCLGDFILPGLGGETAQVFISQVSVLTPLKSDLKEIHHSLIEERCDIEKRLEEAKEKRIRIRG